jgi:3-hydroxyacyl-[acyl-carrier-protein] dehydratase
MNREEIKKILPHREPMLLIDEAFIDGEGSAKGFYTVRGDEFFVNGHFPLNTVVPGVILWEMMAQVTCVLLNGAAENKTPYYTGLNNVRFRSTVKPGDKIEFTSKLLKSKEPFYFAQGSGSVNGTLCVQGEFSFALIGG